MLSGVDPRILCALLMGSVTVRVGACCCFLRPDMEKGKRAIASVTESGSCGSFPALRRWTEGSILRRKHAKRQAESDVRERARQREILPGSSVFRLFPR